MDDSSPDLHISTGGTRLIPFGPSPITRSARAGKGTAVSANLSTVEPNSIPPKVGALPTPGLVYRFQRFARTVFRPPKLDDGWKPANGPVLVIAPHPDDEVIGCGGTILRHAQAGDPTSCVYLTRGEKSKGYSWFTPAQRQAKREQEARNSSHILRISELTFLDGVDGSLADPIVTAKLLPQLDAVLKRIRPRVIFAPHANDNHPDHVAAYQMVRQLVGDGLIATVYEYELWSPLFAQVGVDISGQMKAKLAAIRCHDLAMDAFDYVPTIKGLAAYRSGTLLQHHGYAEAFRKM